MIHPPKKAEQFDRPPDTRTLPPTFDPAYVEGVVKPFFLSAKYEGEPPLLPMIDVALSKEAAIPPFRMVDEPLNYKELNPTQSTK